MPTSNSTAVRIDGRVQTEVHLPHHPAPIQVKGALSIDRFEPFERHRDLTVIVRADEFRYQLAAAMNRKPEDLVLEPSHDFTARVKINLEGDSPESAPCRVHAASAFGGEWYSVTLRGLSFPKDQNGKKPHLPSWTKVEQPNTQTPKWRARLLDLPDPRDRSSDFSEGYLVCQWHVAQVIQNAVFDKDGPPAKGLVLFTGETACGKTQIMNHVLHQYICGRLAKSGDRRPHVVALGDPVETVLFEGRDKDQPHMLKDIPTKLRRSRGSRQFDYTARVLGLDVYSVADALKDALRETPSAYVISELRTERDFLAALEFAATGHVVFATAHNTSLVDTFSKLVGIFQAQTPSQRAALAQRLKAVVHLRPIQLDKTLPPPPQHGKPGPSYYSATLPSIWRANSVGVQNFVADGLASLLPHGASKFETRQQQSGPPEETVLGLAYAAEKIAELQDVKDTDKACDCRRAHYDELLRKAHAADLEVR